MEKHRRLIIALRLVIGLSLLVVAIGNTVGVLRYLSLAGPEGTSSDITSEHGAPDESDADRRAVGEDGVRRSSVDRDDFLMLLGNRYGLFVIFLVVLVQLQPAAAAALIGSSSVNRYKAYFYFFVAMLTALAELIAVALRSSHVSDVSGMIVAFNRINTLGLGVAVLLVGLALYYFHLAGSASATQVLRRATKNVNNDRSTIGNYAGFWNRFGALALDLALVETALFLALLTSLLVGDWDRDAWNQAVAEYGDSILFIMLLLYYTMMEGSTKRATIGKLVYGIAVMDESGERLVWWRAALRNLFKILSAMILFVGFLLAGLTQKKQALHDLITRSFVVKESSLEL